MSNDPHVDSATWDSSVNRRFRRGVSWATVATAVGFPATLSVSALATRLLAPAAAGAYFAIISFVMVGSLVTACGLHQTALREVSRAVGLGEPQQAQDVMGRCRRVIGVAGLMALVAIFVADAFGLATALTGSGTQPVLAIAVGLILLAKASLFLETFALRGLHDYSFSSVLGMAAPHGVTALALGALLLVGAPVDLLVVVWASLFGVVLSVAIGRWRWRRTMRGRIETSLSGRSSPGSIRALLRESIPVWGFTVMNLALSVNVDLLVLAAFRPLEEVAVYGAASRLAQLVGGPALVFNNSSSPLISELHTVGDHSGLEKVTRTSATLGTVPVAAGTLLALAAGGPILGLVFGDTYRAGASIFAILCTGKLVSVAFGQGAAVLMMTGHQHRLARMTAVSATFYVVGSLIATILWGAVALALTSLAVLALQNIGNWALARRHVGVPTHADVRMAARLARRPIKALRHR